MLSLSLFSTPRSGLDGDVVLTSQMILILVAVEWVHRDKQHGLAGIELSLPMHIRWSIYYVLLLLVFFVGGAQQEFIYFQF